MRNIQVLLSSLSQVCQGSTDTHTPTIPEFILSVSSWNRHYLADEIIRIPESQPGCVSSPTFKGSQSPRPGSQNTNLLLIFLVFCSALHCSSHLRSPSLMCLKFCGGGGGFFALGVPPCLSRLSL